MANNISFPKVVGALSPAVVTPGLTEERVLFVGQKLSGTATGGDLVENIQNDGSWDSLFGADSPIAGAIRRGRKANQLTRFDAISIDENAGGAEATGTLAFSGAATAAGSLDVFIGSKKDNKYTLTIANGDSATTIGAALVSALAAQNISLVTGVNTAGSVALTAKSKGTWGNGIGIRVEGSVAGLTFTITAMSGGSGDPVLTGIFDPVGDQRYQAVVWQFDQDFSELKSFLDPRFNPSEDVEDGRGFLSKLDTLANHLSALSSENSQSICYNAVDTVDKATHKGPDILDMGFFKVAEFAALRALRRTDGANIASVVIAREPLDAIGGIRSNSKPYANTAFPNLVVPDPGDGYTRTEADQLEAAGAWIIGPNRAGTAVIADNVVTTYKTDSAGNPDPSLTFLNYVDTATAYREFMIDAVRAQYPQYRATGGSLIPGVDSSNEASVAAFIIQKNREAANLALVNQGVGTINGEQVDYDAAFRDNLTVTLNPVTGRYTAAMEAFIVTQLREVILSINIAFEV